MTIYYVGHIQDSVCMCIHYVYQHVQICNWLIIYSENKIISYMNVMHW